ncbi:hypothetical protein EJB05_01634, partial [Eragrostis curvula]
MRRLAEEDEDGAGMTRMAQRSCRRKPVSLLLICLVVLPWYRLDVYREMHIRGNCTLHKIKIDRQLDDISASGMQTCLVHHNAIVACDHFDCYLLFRNSLQHLSFCKKRKNVVPARVGAACKPGGDHGAEDEMSRIEGPIPPRPGDWLCSDIEGVGEEVYFNLWGNGGAHWSRESNDFDKEEQNSWQTVQRKGKKKGQQSTWRSVHSPQLSKQTQVSVFSRLNDDDLARNENVENQKKKAILTYKEAAMNTEGSTRELAKPGDGVDMEIQPGEAFIEMNDFVNEILNEDNAQDIADDGGQISFQESESIMGGHISMGSEFSVNQPVAMINPTVKEDQVAEDTTGDEIFCTPPTGKCNSTACSSAISQIKLKYGCTEALVEFEVKRSYRLKKTNNGFKQATCKQKSCFGCSAEAPTLSPSVIKNLGTDFCNLSLENVKDEALKKKRKVKAVVENKASKVEQDKKPPANKGKKAKVLTKKIKKKPSNDDKDNKDQN